MEGMRKRAKRLTAATMGPGKERFAAAELLQSPRDFVSRELVKPPGRRREAVCFDARRTPLAAILAWIRGLDDVQAEEDANPRNERGYYIRRVVILKNPRAFSRNVPAEWRERPDITWIATADPADAPTIYRRHLTEQFQGVLNLFAGSRKKPRK